MFDKTKLQLILEDYKKNFAGEHWVNEEYKWINIKHFQKSWNVDAEDFYLMLKESLSKTINLLDSQSFFPKKMILYFAEKDPETVRNMFRSLFDESKSVVDRVENFASESDKLLKLYGQDGWQSHYQNPNSISTYLWLRYPDKYYIYKYTECKKVSEAIDADYKPKKGAKADSLLNAFAMYDEIADYAETDSNLISIFRSCLTDDCYDDPFCRTLAIDIGYYISKYYGQSQPQPQLDTVKYWIYAPGENAVMWEDFYTNGVMGIGWHKVGDLSGFNDADSLKSKIKHVYGNSGNPKNDTLALWQFAKEIKPGDIVFVKKGQNKIIGRGIVSSNYFYDSNLYPHYPNLRKVNWTNNGEWSHPGKAVLKTITDISQYTDYIEKLNAIIDYNQNDDIRYWWLNANPKIWSYSDIKVGETQAYNLYNENGNKRRIFQNFLDAKDGDLVVGYESTPVKKIVALARVAGENNGKEIYFEKTEDLENPIEYSSIKDCPELASMEYMVNPQGSLFKLTKDEFDFIMDTIRESGPVSKIKEPEKYSKQDFLEEVFMTEDSYDLLAGILDAKKNIILQGAPGVGKTFAATRLAYSIMGEKDDNRVELVQFHQNYSYEDFIMGYKPIDNGFELKAGIFFRFCQRAANNPNKSYFFIIDEINRGNLSKIFGELLMSIENGYRGKCITLAYSGQKFTVPENLYIIGMMNTADRSLAMIDYALRRRFSFFDMKPGFETEGFKAYVSELKNDKLNSVIDAIIELNKEIAKDKSLGSGFCIGHSYFCGLAKENLDDIRIKSIVQFDILPMLREYWFDDQNKYDTWEKKFNGVI